MIVDAIVNVISDDVVDTVVRLRQSDSQKLRHWTQQDHCNFRWILFDIKLIHFDTVECKMNERVPLVWLAFLTSFAWSLNVT